MVSALMAGYSGSIQLSSYKLPFRIQRFKDFNRSRFVFQGSLRRPTQRSFPIYNNMKCASSGKNYAKFDDEFHPEPFWLSLMKESIWGLRSLLIFLAEQPGQLKYIEWPTFQSTLKTASLTLVLVALLIVALSSIDSALCYLLALLLRRPA